MTPIVRVIAHTTFLGVPPDLLPTDKATQLQAKRFVEADTICKSNNQKSPERTDFFRPESIEAEARRFVTAAGQDQGTDAERLIECAGRNCYDSYGIGRPSAEYHQHILDVNHGSVSEHASLTFYLANISRGLTHELVRHRVGVAISQRSTRYVDESNSAYVHHPLVEAYIAKCGIPSGPENGITSVQEDRVMYRKVVTMLESWLIEQGADKGTARKQARGAARGYLGNALATEMVWTCNVRALRTVIAQRVKAAADAEIRILFGMIYEAAKPYWPTYLGTYQQRPCPDGLGFELYEPSSPAERLKVAEAELENLRAAQSAVDSPRG